jgi:hypothetical protein
MTSSLRITLAVLALLALVAGTALAARHAAPETARSPLAASPAASHAGNETEDAEDPGDADAGTTLTDDAAQALVDRLAANGLAGDVATLQDLAARYGVGGAVRLIGWADASGKTIDELAAMRDEGTGWGLIAKQLGLHPGIGVWMRDPGAADHAGDAADEAADNADEAADGASDADAAGRSHAPGLNKPH